MLNVIFGFDYELFFGENYYSAEKVLFEPTEKIVQILNKHNLRATFFADVCSVFQHEKYLLSEYCDQFSAQLCEVTKKNQDIQLHIHPHWLKSTFENDEWKFPSGYYRIHDFMNTEKDASKIIDNCINYLYSVIKKVDSKYECVAFRAGGYCLQPYKELIGVLFQKGIRIDSSVAMYRDNKNDEAHYYDYRKLPQRCNFWINPDKDLYEAETSHVIRNSLFEVPIGYYKRSLFRRFFLLKKDSFFKGKPNGKAMPHTENNGNIIHRLVKYKKEKGMLSVDGMSYKYLIKQLNKLYRKYDADNNEVYLSIIGHPKSFTGEAFENFDKLLAELKQMNGKYKVLTFRDVYNEIK